MPDFRKALRESRFIIFDGSTGVLLQARGLPAGESPEAFGLRRPEVIESVSRDHLAAGAMVTTTNTFGGTRFKLDPGLDVVGLNREMASIARRAAGESKFVAGSVGPTGKFTAPLGDLAFRDLVEAFKEQIRGLVEGGADLILGETHFDLAEARAIAVASREVAPSLPIGLSMTFEAGRTLTGTPPETFADLAANMAVDFIGLNCGAGPDDMAEIVERLSGRSALPILVQPNAGLPELIDGKTVFRLGQDAFAEKTARFAELPGVRMLGGCCGVTPEHISALAGAVGAREPLPTRSAKPYLAMTSRSRSVLCAPHLPTVVIGERINPTGKKALTAELQAGQFSEALRMGGEQLDLGAPVLDVNVGAPMVDEVLLLPRLVETLSSRFEAPLAIDSANPDAVRAALDAYPATPLVNSISGEPGRLELLGPLCKAHGAPFILLPLAGKKLPVTAKERLASIEALLEKAFAMGIDRRLIMVDVLALTVSSKADAAKHCLETIRYCADHWGLPTVFGLSNISFGLPARELLNSTFLTMSMAAGLSACIANPGSVRLREALASAEVLLARDRNAERFIAGFAAWKPTSGGAPGASGGAGGGQDQNQGGRSAAPMDLGTMVIKGAKDAIVARVEEELAKGRDPFAMVDEDLVPAIMEVGSKYERKEYFLPQLILSAETMRAAFTRLKPLLEREGGPAREKVIMATVEGDIHDIGKNIVCLMLRNQGFDVVDMGKDVAAEAIVDKAQEVGARLIGLSALMTTTMVRMEDTVKLVRDRGLGVKVMVGGAVVTDAYAKSIGADGYAADAVEAVRLAASLLGKPDQSVAMEHS